MTPATVSKFINDITINGSAALSDVSIGKKNVVLKVDKQTLTVNSADSKDIALSDGRIISGGNIFDAKKVSVTSGSATSGSVDLSKLKVKNVDGSAAVKALKITGTTSANSLIGGSGYSSITGGAGKDTFIYKPGEGTDKIFDYQNGDMLKILKQSTVAAMSFSRA